MERNKPIEAVKNHAEKVKKKYYSSDIETHTLEKKLHTSSDADVETLVKLRFMMCIGM
jgi:hypothetical protein